jgi:hypothetical protein
MTIRIDQRGRLYFVFLNDSKEPVMQGQWYSKWYTRSAQFSDSSGNDKLFVKSSFRLDFWNINFEIEMPKIKFSGKLEPVKFFRGHWCLQIGADVYDFYLHKGHKKSLFKNRQQIASYDKKKFHTFEKDTLYISANDNEPIELIISFAICFDLGSDNDGAAMTFDGGNLGPESKAVDEKWKPALKINGY